MYNICPFYCPFNMVRHINDTRKTFTNTCMRIGMTENHVIANQKEINYTNKYIQESIKIPVLKGIENKNIEKQINNSIESDIVEFKQQMEQVAYEYGLEYEKQGKQSAPYIISTNYTTTYNKNNILSITIFYYQYINGKSSYIKTSYNFDLTTGKPLGLNNLFKKSVSYTEIIDKEIRNQLSSNKVIYLPNAAENFKGIKEDQPFYLEDGNIVLYFGFNEIAPTISEIPIIKIPFSTFKNEINPILLT